MGKQGLTQNEIDAKVEYLFAHSFNHTLHAYIDITGDLIAGTLLSQIMYWFSENKNNDIRANIYKDGHYWIAKRREDWMQEIRISKKQYDCAIKKLTDEGIGLVEVKKYHFNGVPMTHIRPITENINKAVAEWKNNLAQSFVQDSDGCNGSSPNGNMEVPQTGSWNFPKGEIGSSPNGNMEVPQTGNSYNIYNNIYNKTETTNRDYNTKTTYREDQNILSGKPNDIHSSAPDLDNSPKKKSKPKPKNHPEEIKQIIDYCNQVCGTNYKYQSKATADLINARLNDGFTVGDFYKVIDKKYTEWRNNSEYCKYIRPETLFRPSHFESYLNQKSSSESKDTGGISEEYRRLYRSVVVE